MAVLRKFQLLVSEENKFRVWGISSYEKPARFAWFINKMRDLYFFRTEDYLLKRNNKPLAFLKFSAIDTANASDYLLLKNYSGEAYLIPEFRLIDYILMVRYEDDLPDFDPITSFSKLPVVQVCFEIKTDQLKASTKNELCELYEYNDQTYENKNYRNHRPGNSRLRNTDKDY
jgi:hypothetical protein